MPPTAQAIIKIDPGTEALRAKWEEGNYAGLQMGGLIGFAVGLIVAALIGRWLREKT